jgi:hypothetical protein
MQIYASSPHHYIVIIPICIFCLICNFSVTHTISIIILTVLFSVGISEEGYYNMAISLIITMICLAHNIETVYAQLKLCIAHEMLDFILNILGNFRMYLLMV